MCGIMGFMMKSVETRIDWLNATPQKLIDHLWPSAVLWESLGA